MMWPTFAAELLAARASLDLSTEVGLALRADRHRLAMSQREYAAHRSWTLATVIRLETAAADMKLRDVVDALEGTPFLLSLCHRPPNASEAAGQIPTDGPAHDTGTPAVDQSPDPVHPAFWPRAELIARVRGGGRRFAAHHVTEQVSSPPPWWWYAESSRAGTVAPDWYAPRFTRRDASAS
jgi:hypothetical protein